MKFSNVNGEKKEAFPGGTGICFACGSATLSKCGKKKIWHWAHKFLSNCDSWWENETQWHRDWKNQFPEKWQEVVHFDPMSGEKHIADIKTNKDLVIELQNSPISIDELKSREEFYNNMIWIINGTAFKKNFHILDKLPNPEEVLFRDIAFKGRKKDDLGRCYYKYSEIIPNSNLVQIHSLQEIQEDINKHYIGHHLYEWVRPRSVWLESGKRRFIDFGDDHLWELKIYDKKGLPCIRKYDKENFIRRANTGNNNG